MLDNNSSSDSYKISIVKETEAKFSEIALLHKKAIESGHDICIDPDASIVPTLTNLRHIHFSAKIII